MRALPTLLPATDSRSCRAQAAAMIEGFGKIRQAPRTETPNAADPSQKVESINCVVYII